jgi:ABC-type transporter Mla subunit MlaD
MKKYPTFPRTNRKALAALVLGEINTLLDKLEALQGNVNATSENIKVTINQLEAAGEKYNPSRSSREFTL